VLTLCFARYADWPARTFETLVGAADRGIASLGLTLDLAT
jgi:hypothetical protein